MIHKNSLGAAAVLATAYFLVLTLQRRISPLWGIGLCSLSGVAIVQSQSRTSMIVAAFCLTAAAYLATTGAPSAVRARRWALGLVLAVSIAPFAVAPVVSLVGTSDPLNGRTRIWGGALTIFGERPLTGYGYEAVWGRASATLLPHIPITAHRSALSAHNSIINIGTELGLPAAILAAAFLFAALVAAADLYGRAPSLFSCYGLVFLITFTELGCTEAHVLQIHSMFWILAVAVTVAVRHAADEAPVGGHRLQLR